ncbi:peptidoglycan-binding domain-containing protein [Streptomyces sp. NPDC001795]|uniref:peptidoglycan-binding domain-containing protein n=1 Tax=unclassified Streptomyces TaxID=2593676 RepID=UPI0033349BBB
MNARRRLATVLTGAVLIGTGLAAAAPVAGAAPGVSDIAYGSGNRTGVLCVQHGINDWAQRTGQGRPLAEDHDFGANTRTWVRKFQSASHLAVDGIVGKNTGNSILDNLTGDSTWRANCYDYIPSTHH